MNIKKSKELFRQQQQQQQQQHQTKHHQFNQPTIQQQYQLQSYNSNELTQMPLNNSNIKNPTFNYTYGKKYVFLNKLKLG